MVEGNPFLKVEAHYKTMKILRGDTGKIRIFKLKSNSMVEFFFLFSGLLT